MKREKKKETECNGMFMNANMLCKYALLEKHDQSSYCHITSEFAMVRSIEEETDIGTFLNFSKKTSISIHWLNARL